MRILVFGAGSLGSAMGGMLSAENEVTLLGRRENMESIREEGLRLTGEVDLVARVGTAETTDGLEEPDLILLTTKAYNTKAAVQLMESKRWETASVITFQNGLGNLERLRSWKAQRAFGGTTTMGSSLISPGFVRISGMGTTVVGADLDPEGARSISELIARSGIPSIVRTDIESEIWSKAIVNACINPLTAVLRVPNGRLLDSDVILRLMSEICVECTDVATYAGITLPEGRAIDRVLGVAKNTSGNRSSMLRDVELGRRTEIGQINGMIRKIGVVGGIPVPLNRALTSMIEAMEPLAAGERLIS